MSHVPPPATSKVTLVTYSAAKAYMAAAAAGIVAALAALATGLSDGQVTPLEWVLVISALIVGTGITGPATYATENKPRFTELESDTATSG